MKSPQVTYNMEKGRFEAHSDGYLDTFFVFPLNLQDGDRLPSLLWFVSKEEKPFQFDGQYNPENDSLEFLFDGPEGYAFKISLSVDPGATSSYFWKAKKHGWTTNFEAQEDAVLYVPRYVCLERATTVEAKREIMQKPSFYGTCVQRSFCTIRLKIGVVPGNRYFSRAPLATGDNDYEYVHLDCRIGDDVTEGVDAAEFASGAGDLSGLEKHFAEEEDEKSLLIERTYEACLTANEKDRLERTARRCENVRVFDAFRPSGGKDGDADTVVSNPVGKESLAVERKMEARLTKEGRKGRIERSAKRTEKVRFMDTSPGEKEESFVKDDSILTTGEKTGKGRDFPRKDNGISSLSKTATAEGQGSFKEHKLDDTDESSHKVLRSSKNDFTKASKIALPGSRKLAS